METLEVPAAWLRLSPEQFELVCQANPDAVFELSPEGLIGDPLQQTGAQAV